MYVRLTPRAAGWAHPQLPPEGFDKREYTKVLQTTILIGCTYIPTYWTPAANGPLHICAAAAVLRAI